MLAMLSSSTITSKSRIVLAAITSYYSIFTSLSDLSHHQSSTYGHNLGVTAFNAVIAASAPISRYQQTTGDKDATTLSPLLALTPATSIIRNLRPSLFCGHRDLDGEIWIDEPATISREDSKQQQHQLSMKGGNHEEEEPELQEQSSTKKKYVIFIRHGRTYMNDYINGIHYGKPNFTDVFETDAEFKKYRDSPLNEMGNNQAKQLARRLEDLRTMLGSYSEDSTSNITSSGSQELIDESLLFGLSKEHAQMLAHDIDLVVVSPLTRALQTLEVGLLSHLNSISSENDNTKESGRTENDRSERCAIPIIAVPESSERVYLISDHGRPLVELSKEYTFVDFHQPQQRLSEGLNDGNNVMGNDNPSGGSVTWYYNPTCPNDIGNYIEWRPSGEGQIYSCLGEPQNEFDARMNIFYEWLSERPETTILVISHHGVINWFTQVDNFENCGIRIVPFDQLGRDSEKNM